MSSSVEALGLEILMGNLWDVPLILTVLNRGYSGPSIPYYNPYEGKVLVECRPSEPCKLRDWTSPAEFSPATAASFSPLWFLGLGFRV